jgi:hypothetical protein
MMRALLLGAFATTAFGVECGKDVGAVACHDLGPNSDFNIQNDASVEILQTGKVTINQAIQFVGDTPWDKSADLSSQAGNGCTFRDESNGGDNGPGTDVTSAGVSKIGSAYACALTTGTVCSGTANTASAERTYSLSHTLQHMVANLDNAGRYSVYFQRVLENPIFATGGSVTLRWIAENACKIYVDVEFECTGGNCVEVTTIVCASFAGIDADNKGVVSIECKVPAGFAIAKDSSGNTAGANLAESAVANINAGTDDDVWPGSLPIVSNNAAVTGAGLTKVLSATITSTAALGQGEKFSGSLDLSAFVKSPSGANIFTNTEQPLHSAKYNLTRASNFAKTFNMPVNVLFYSSIASGVVKTEVTTIVTEAGNAFGSAALQRPFLAKTNVEYGAITQHNHAYLSVLAKVTTDGTPKFNNLKVSKVSFNKQGAGAVDKCTGGTCCSQATDANGAAVTTWWNPASGPQNKYPHAYMYCGDLMGPTGPLGAGTPAVGVTAGDTLVISLGWQLVGQAASNGAGKAALLQDAADEVQSVEVSLTIQLGGGETTITTAGGSDGSADPTVTYIIIAVCIVAAGLILAVVVVAFMCMRNRSQEAIVSMSPQKCTVAAVYDISQPKKADAMDV